MSTVRAATIHTSHPHKFSSDGKVRIEGNLAGGACSDGLYCSLHSLLQMEIHAPPFVLKIGASSVATFIGKNRFCSDQTQITDKLLHVIQRHCKSLWAQMLEGYESYVAAAHYAQVQKEQGAMDAKIRKAEEKAASMTVTAEREASKAARAEEGADELQIACITGDISDEDAVSEIQREATELAEYLAKAAAEAEAANLEYKALQTQSHQAEEKQEVTALDRARHLVAEEIGAGRKPSEFSAEAKLALKHIRSEDPVVKSAPARILVADAARVAHKRVREESPEIAKAIDTHAEVKLVEKGQTEELEERIRKKARVQAKSKPAVQADAASSDLTQTKFLERTLELTKRSGGRMRRGQVQEFKAIALYEELTGRKVFSRVRYMGTEDWIPHLHVTPHITIVGCVDGRDNDLQEVIEVKTRTKLPNINKRGTPWPNEEPQMRLYMAATKMKRCRQLQYCQGELDYDLVVEHSDSHIQSIIASLKEKVEDRVLRWIDSDFLDDDFIEAMRLCSARTS